MDERRLSHCRRVVELESRRYLHDVGLLKNKHRHFSMRVARYILCSYLCIPVRIIMIGERPYSTDIHSEISSAMSYDQEKSRPTPSTSGMAKDLGLNFGVPYVVAERWFRDSWKYLGSGALVVNCNLFLHFSSPHSVSETVPFQRWLRCILDVSMSLLNEKVDVVCMGVPASNVVDSALRSIGLARVRINKVSCINPAAIAKRATGDAASQVNTLGKKSASKAIYRAIKRSDTILPLTQQDYFSELCRDMSAQVHEVDKVIRAANNIASEFEDAYKELEGNHRLPNVKEAVNSFVMAMIEYRDSVLKDIVASSVASVADSPGKIGKATEWGSKRAWKKAATSVGASSKMSVVSDDTGGVPQVFADEDAEQVSFADDLTPVAPSPAPIVPSGPEAPKKKMKKIVRRVKKPEVPAQSATEVMAKLDNQAISTLKAVSYYMSDSYAGMSMVLHGTVDDSISAGAATTEDVCLIIDTAARDVRNVGIVASTSLGIDSGTVSETCMLPRVIQKLVESRI